MPRPADFDTCPHDRGPGITVCLRCRADAHRKAAASRRRIVTRAGIVAVSAAVLVAAGRNAMSARSVANARSSAGDTSRSESFQVAQAGAAEPARMTVATSVSAPAASLAPVVPVGQTDIGDGRSVERAGDSITVHFDTPVFRTRRRDKFEQVVRATLPAVYGAFADSVLAEVPAGELAAAGDLLTELPARGVVLPAHEGWMLTLWPGTRPGHDGLLVVSYRVTVARTK